MEVFPHFNLSCTKPEYSFATYRFRNIKHYNGCLGSAVVHGGQAVVAFLSGCVPNLELYRRVVQAHGLREERR